jgi:hypothetical protein
MVTAKRCLKMSEMSAAGKFFGSGLEEMRKAVRKIDGLSRVQSIYNTLLTDSGQNLLIFYLLSLMKSNRPILQKCILSPRMLQKNR